VSGLPHGSDFCSRHHAELRAAREDHIMSQRKRFGRPMRDVSITRTNANHFPNRKPPAFDSRRQKSVRQEKSASLPYPQGLLPLTPTWSFGSRQSIAIVVPSNNALYICRTESRECGKCAHECGRMSRSRPKAGLFSASNVAPLSRSSDARDRTSDGTVAAQSGRAKPARRPLFLKPDQLEFVSA
jgi:hypothetical protein